MLQQIKPQTVRPAKTSLGKSARMYFDESAYVDPAIVAGIPGYSQRGIIYVGQTQTSVDFSLSNVIAYWSAPLAVASYSYEIPASQAREYNRALAERLCEEHPDISTDPGIFGGNPHINNVRLTVGNILGKLYNYGSTRAVADIYAPYVTESQVKEAIAYAQDFLEEAIHAGEPSEVDG